MEYNITNDQFYQFKQQNIGQIVKFRPIKYIEWIIDKLKRTKKRAQMSPHYYNTDCINQQKQNRRQMFNSDVNSINMLKQSASTRHYTQAKSQQNLYLLKLQSKALQLLKKIDNQKFQIQTLTCQAESLMKLCDQQKSYLKTVNIDMMRQQYEEELMMLFKERQKILSLIKNIQEENQLFRLQQNQKINTTRFQNQTLTQKIQTALIHKQQLLKLINQKNTLKKQFQSILTEQQQKLDQLRHVQRKVVISLKQLEHLRTNKINSVDNSSSKSPS